MFIDLCEYEYYLVKVYFDIDTEEITGISTLVTTKTGQIASFHTLEEAREAMKNDTYIKPIGFYYDIFRINPRNIFMGSIEKELLAYGGILSLLKYIKRYYEQQHITHVVI
jgi:hypothetical protein